MLFSTLGALGSCFPGDMGEGVEGGSLGIAIWVYKDTIDTKIIQRCGFCYPLIDPIQDWTKHYPIHKKVRKIRQTSTLANILLLCSEDMIWRSVRGFLKCWWTKRTINKLVGPVSLLRYNTTGGEERGVEEGEERGKQGEARGRQGGKKKGRQRGSEGGGKGGRGKEDGAYLDQNI